MNDVYINQLFTVLPNRPVSNDEIDNYLGLIGGEVSRVKKIVLGRNGIKQRYYALTEEGRITHCNAELTAEAVNGLFRHEVDRNSIEMLCCATTTPDQLIPSHASMVHGLLKIKPLELLSVSGVCLTSLQALKALFHAIKLGDKHNGICTTSELISPTFRAGNYNVGKEYAKKLGDNKYMEFEKDFLRFMLSDGANALFLENTPRQNGISLHIEWIEVKSYACNTPTCMYMGAELKPDGELKGWKEFSIDELQNKSILSICQNFKILMSGMKYWVDFIEDVISKYNIDVDSIDYIVPHISSMFIGEELKKEMQRRNVRLYENWYVNLAEVGNIGSASIFIGLGGLMKNIALQKGNKILLLVPESARFSYGMALLTVV